MATIVKYVKYENSTIGVSGFTQNGDMSVSYLVDGCSSRFRISPEVAMQLSQVMVQVAQSMLAHQVEAAKDATGAGASTTFADDVAAAEERMKP